MATIMASSDQKFKKYLTTKRPVDGYSIASIEWSQKAGQTRVTISKDGKFATLNFDQTLLSQSTPASARTAQNMPLIASSDPGKASRVPASMPTPLPAQDLVPLHRPSWENDVLTEP